MSVAVPGGRVFEERILLMMRVVAGGSRSVRGIVLLLAAALCLAVAPWAAFAGKGVVSVFGSSGSGDGQFSFAGATAVNVSSSDVYVVDPGLNRVDRFDAGGSFLGAFGWGVLDGSAAAQTCSSGCQAAIAGNGAGQFDSPQGVAVDSSGSVFVVDGNNARVEKFDASGNFVSQFGSAGSGDGQLSAPQGIAIDPTDGSIYVADTGDNRVVKFDSSGAFVDVFGEGVTDGSSSFEVCTSSCQAGLPDSADGAFNFPTRVAVDSTGRVYVLDAGNGRIERFTSADAFDEQFDPTDVNGGTAPFEIAIGPGNDHLYVAQIATDFSEQRVFEIDAAGTVVDTHGVGSGASNPSGLALSAEAQTIYLADGGNARVFVMDDVTAPTVTIDPATGVNATGASLSGAVTPNGDPNVGWHFEISTDDTNWSQVAADQDAGNGNTPVPVSQALTGLIPNTTYFVRLAATRPFNATTFSSEVQLTTPAIAPDVTTDVADDVTPNHATLHGRVNPHNSATTYYFEYGTTTTYGTSLPATQDADAGSAEGVEAELQPLRGLQPGTTYHFRLVATNQGGTTPGADQNFTTSVAPPESTPRAGIPGASFLPDNRGWEKVSPDDKNGGDIMGDPQRVRVADNGNAAAFPSLVGFGDAIGTSVATDYMSTRGANGWTTHAITPRQDPSSLKMIFAGLESLYVGPFSSDLTKGVFLGVSPVTDDVNVANVSNIYMRTNLLNAGGGSYQLLSACPLCAGTSTPLPPLPGPEPPDRPLILGGAAPRFAGASADFGHVIFESPQALTSDAAGSCADIIDLSSCPGKLYEWDHGTVRLAGILPPGACGTPPCVPAAGSQAGQGAGGFRVQLLTPHTISSDGARIIFTVPDSPMSPSGALYMRINHNTTVQLNESERTPPDPSGPQSATYWDASTNGSRVFFTSSEALTEDAPLNGDQKLYAYDATKPSSDPHNLTLVSVDQEPADPADVVTVLGASADGRYVYFGAAGQLVTGQPVLGTVRGLYAWHDGTIKYITTAPAPDILENTTAANVLFRRPTSRVTPDGSHLLFSSTAPGAGPTGYDQGHCHALDQGCRELYIYSYDSQRLACVSCNPNGTPAANNALVADFTGAGGSITTTAQPNVLSTDGQHVFFSTTEALVPQDVNGKTDVYEYDLPSGTLHLISSGTDPSDSLFMGATPSGSDVLFLTRAQLVGTDYDNNYDLYDARVGGGVAQAPALPACSGDACRGPQSGAPEAPPKGSSVITGGNAPTKVKPKPRALHCHRGYMRKRVHGRAKCVRKPRHRPKHRARRASSQTRVK